MSSPKRSRWVTLLLILLPLWLVGSGAGALWYYFHREKKQAQVTASGGARGVDPEKDSKGGSNPKPVVTRITAADIAAFKKDGGLP